MNWLSAPLLFTASMIVTQAAHANGLLMEIAACKLSFQDMLRQPKDKPLVLTETMMNCGKHGQHSM